MIGKNGLFGKNFNLISTQLVYFEDNKSESNPCFLKLRNLILFDFFKIEVLVLNKLTDCFHISFPG